jgi:hypothetical protein
LRDHPRGGKQVDAVPVIDDCVRLVSEVVVQLPARLRQFVLHHRSVELGLKLLALPHCLVHDHKFILILVFAALIRIPGFLLTVISKYLAPILPVLVLFA